MADNDEDLKPKQEPAQPAPQEAVPAHSGENRPKTEAVRAAEPAPINSEPLVSEAEPVVRPPNVHEEMAADVFEEEDAVEHEEHAVVQDEDDAAMEEEFRQAVADADQYSDKPRENGEPRAGSSGQASAQPPVGNPPPQEKDRRQQHPPRQRHGRRGGQGQQHGQGHRERGGGHGQQQHGRGHGHGREQSAHHDGSRKEVVTGRHQPHGHGRKPVKVEILANTSFEETRIAVLENGRLVELLWERKSAENIVGNIYKGVIENVLPGISSAFIDIGFEKNAYLYISDVLGDTRAPIDHTLKKGQQVMIQVAKEAIGTKGMKVTMNVSLPGRYLVFTPFEKEVGISKHIADGAERSRLSTLVNKLAQEHLGGRGIVVRTEAEGATDVELTREVKYLWRTWEAIQRRFDSTPAPCLLHKDLDVTMQVARDMLSEEVYVYLMDNKDAYQNVLDFVGKISPDLKENIRYYDGKTPIFSAFNIESEIEKLRQIKVGLPSGGTIVVQEAESLCAIDVNTGRFTGSKSQEETVTMTNIEAANEIAHQLRLRNIGGIVVIDFIDMKKASNRNRVMEALAEAVKRDRAKIRILPITRLGLIEMTRERKRESTVSLMTDECPECRGAGRVLSAESLRIRIQREIKELTQGRPGGNIRLQLHPQLHERFKEMQNIIEKNVHRAIKVQPDPMLPWEDYKIILE